MTSFTFSAEQVRSAPPEVRRWIGAEVAKALPGSVGYGPAAFKSATLAGAAMEEMAKVLRLISGNLPVARVFFELSREPPAGPAPPPFRALSIADLLHHAQVGDGRRLLECLDVINDAFRAVHGDPEASLFAYDERGRLYLHEATCRNIHQLWERLVLEQAQIASSDAAAVGPAPEARGTIRDPLGLAPEHAFAASPAA